MEHEGKCRILDIYGEFVDHNFSIYEVVVYISYEVY